VRFAIDFAECGTNLDAYFGESALFCHVFPPVYQIIFGIEALLKSLVNTG